MSTGTQYERYKEALERGHVASLRGTLEDALAAYAEAAAIVPGRAAPLAGAGTALLRRQRAVDALRYFGPAITIAPRDEVSNFGRAQALVMLDRRAEAADAFDILADIRATAGRLPDAVDAACRALELAEGRDRRRALRHFADALRAVELDDRGRKALGRATLLLEPPATSQRAPVAKSVPDSAPLEVASAARRLELGPGPLRDLGAAWSASAGAAASAPDAAAEPGPEAAAEEEPEFEQLPVFPIVPPSPLDRPLSQGTTLDQFEAAAQVALDSGSREASLERLLDVAAACRRDGRLDAALDACYRAVAVAPDHVDLHLGMAELYTLRGWSALAAEKLDLVDRLAQLDGDVGALERVAASRDAAD